MSETDPLDRSVIERIFDVVAETSVDIRNALPGRRTEIDAENPSGDRQLEADAYADELLCDRIGALDGVASYVSEERESAVSTSENTGSLDAGDGYAVAVDPLDGSSNLRSNNAMGTIVGVYETSLPARGRDLVAAGYVLYGPITTMLVAMDGVLTEEVLSPGDKSDVISPDKVKAATSGVDRHVVDSEVTLPAEPTVYGFGGRVPDWLDDFADFAHDIERELKLRYGGAMVGDVNQVITYGGIFSYPALENRPDGKLRLQFEANPMAFIIDAAGGRSSDGSKSLLDVEPESLHQRTPVHLGNTELIDRLESRIDR